MARRFSADNSEIRYTLQAGSNFTGAWSLALLINFHAANNTWQGLLSHYDSTPAVQLAIERAGPGGTADTVASYRPTDGTVYGGTTIRGSDGWALIGSSKAAGIALPRTHVFKGGSWFHTNSNANLSNPATQSGGQIRLGEFDDADDLDAWVAADAGWAQALTDLEFEALAANKLIADWLTTGTPAYVHQHNQDNATDVIDDLTGNGNTSAVISATTMDTGNEPTGWTYYGVATADNDTKPGQIGMYDPGLAPNAWF